MFLVQYGDGMDIEKEDVEVIRQDLERRLKYGNRSLLPTLSSAVINLSDDADGDML